MRKKTPAELERAKIAKTIRTLARLEASLAADERINELLPDTLEAFDAALASGELLQVEDKLKELMGGDSASGQ